ncbi:putative chromatin remodeler Bromodomain family [Lupinus albus]|uniref:Putative chromatin remodeler Bromodomain family n=1 Tax=Lupinus albus TaxID=3870 RepID=A0A6A4P756_LUPAL|nr:putative chromatin remodeler Bromodomain family [Lupinus albus]
MLKQKISRFSGVTAFMLAVWHLIGKLENQVNDVEQFYHSIDVQVKNSKEKGREKHLSGTKKPLQGASCSGPIAAAAATAKKNNQELMRQFSTILNQITMHEWAWPFMDPVDVEGLGLHDYYEVIDKPMDFSTIRSKIAAKDGSGYKNVREIYADVRLIFNNAMKYNDKKHNIHNMAKTLLKKFEDKWLELWPKVDKEEKRQLAEEAQLQLNMQLAQEATYASMARNLSVSLHEVDMQLESLKALVIQKCRKLSDYEKTMLGNSLPMLSPENLVKALQIVSENNPAFQPNTLEVDLDIDAQSDYTMWRLNVFVKDALQAQGRTAEGTAVNHDNGNDDNNNSKRRRVL